MDRNDIEPYPVHHVSNLDSKQTSQAVGIEAMPNNPGTCDLTALDSCLEHFAEYQQDSNTNVQSIHSIDPISDVTESYLQTLREHRQRWPKAQVHIPELEIYRSVIQYNTYNVFGA